MEHQNQNQETLPNKALKIMRKSTHKFLTHLHLFSSTPTLLSLPFSLSLLLHLSSPNPSPLLHHRLHSLLLAAGLPLTSPISQFLLLKLSQTLSSTLYSLPLALSFLLLSKSSTLQTLNSNSDSSPFFPLLRTHLASLFLLLAVNSASLSLLCLASPLPTFALFPAAVLYSVLLAKAIVVCNLALIASGTEGNLGGISAVIKAFNLIKGKYLTALALALPGNILMAAVEVVFRCRVYGVAGERWVWGVAAEMVVIAYLYSLLIVWDTVVWGIFYQSCKEESECEIGIGDEKVEEEYACDLRKLRALEEGFSC